MDMREMKLDGIRHAVIDVDNTIVRTNIVELYLYMKRKRMKGPARRLKWWMWLVPFALFRVPLYLAVDFRNREAFQRLFYKRYGEFTVAEVEEDAAAFFGEVLSAKRIRSTHDLIPELKRRGIEVMLLSTNIEPVVKQVARYFGVSYTCLRLLESEGRACVDLEPLPDFKGRAIAAYEPSTTLAVADSKHDLPVLSYVEHPIIVADKRKRWMERVGRNPVILPGAVGRRYGAKG